MSKILKLSLAVGIIVIFFGSIFFVIFRSKTYTSRASESNIVELFEIKKNEGTKTIGLNLEKSNLIKNKYYFYYYLRAEKLAQKIQAGNYELSPNMSIEEIVRKMILGETKEAYTKLVIPEGFTNAKIIKRIEAIDPKLAQEFKELINCRCQSDSDCACAAMKNKYYFLREIPSGLDLEGYVFPDTYFIYPEDDAIKLATKFFDNFNDKINSEIIDSIKFQGKTLHEIVTMASVVEKEVRSDNDKKRVAGIFWNRVDDNYLLQSCATLAYILGEDKKQYSIEDTQIESPYNTYQNIGLPPGPVSNPGLKSIEASIFPEKSDYYYFLSDLKTGETIFSKTLEEHVDNKYKHGL